MDDDPSPDRACTGISRHGSAAVVTAHDRAQRFLEHVDADRDWAATRLGLDVLAADGVEALVDGLLAPAMEETGRRWQDGTYRVADERHVTSLVDEVLQAAATRVPHPTEEDPPVLITCAEGEQHSLPSRMLSLQLRARGEHVRHVGAALPASELEDGLRGGRIEALLVSCTMSAALVGVADMVAVAHRTGVPVLVGGRAMRHHPRAASALGADGTATGADEVQATLAAWRTRGVPVRSPASGLDPSGERAMLGPDRAGIVRAVRSGLTPGAGVAGHDEVDGLVRMLEVSLLLDDPDVLHDHVQWLRVRERASEEGCPPVDRLLETVRVKLPGRLRRSRSYLTSAAARSGA